MTPEHWSKDCVEHLRSVHFGLMALTMGLILLVVTAPTYNAVTALVQIDEIIYLKQHWSRDWVFERTDNKEVEVLSVNSGVEFEPNSATLPSIPYKPKGKTGLWIAPKVKINALRLFGPEPYQEPPASLYKFNTELGDFEKFPETLGEFQNWWSDLEKPYVYFLPFEIPDSWKNDDGETIQPPSWTNPIEVDFWLTFKNRTAKSEFPEFYYTGFIEKVQGKRVHVSIPISSVLKAEVNQDFVVSLFRNLKKGPFDQSFQDLETATRQKKDLSLDEIKGFLHDEAAKGPEVFEIFGMKLPAGQVTAWGDVLLLSVQLCFFLYLRRLSGELNADAPGWEVPWIGMDSSGLSKTILYVTVVILPCLATILLAWQTGIRISGSSWAAWKWHWTAQAKAALLIAPIILSLLLGLLAWKYRPQLVNNAV
jgi:hypothetical protein